MKKGAGSIFTNLNKDIVEQINIPIMNKEYQLKTSNLLSSMDQLIEFVAELIENMKFLKSYVLSNVFYSNSIDNAVYSKLSEISSFRRGSFPQPYGNKEWYDGENSMPFVQVCDVKNNMRLVKKTKQQISTLAMSKSVFIPKGSIVVTLQGSVGRVAETHYSCYLDRTILYFKEISVKVDKSYFKYAIQVLFDFEKDRAEGGIIKTITIDSLKEFKIPIFPLQKQKKIGELLSSMDQLIDLYDNYSGKLKEQKKYNLNKIFS